MNMDHNLFKYATSELSQDAFLCWLLSYAMEDGRNANVILHDCALAMLERMCQQKEDQKIVPKVVLSIYRQYYHMDVLIRFQTITGEEYYLIIEDKTYTNEHDNQLTQYVERLKKEKEVDERHILGVYFKSSIQGDLADVEKSKFTVMVRPDILKVLNKYYDEMQGSDTSSDIFMSYCEKLSEDERTADLYLTTPPTEWDYPQIESFLEHMKSQLPLQLGNGLAWNYVAQKNGGFMALYDMGHQLAIEDSGAECSIYMQCEFYPANQESSPGSACFCIKLCVDPQHTLAEETKKQLSNELLEMIPGRDKDRYALSEYGFVRPARLQAATYMTIANYQLYGNKNQVQSYEELGNLILTQYGQYKRCCDHLKETGQLLA